MIAKKDPIPLYMLPSRLSVPFISKVPPAQPYIRIFATFSCKRQLPVFAGMKKNMEQHAVSRESTGACERRIGFTGNTWFFFRKGPFKFVDGEVQKNNVGSPGTSTSSTTSGAKEPQVSSPRMVKNIWVPGLQPGPSEVG